jgi:hypothetical protein
MLEAALNPRSALLVACVGGCGNGLARWPESRWGSCPPVKEGGRGGRTPAAPPAQMFWPGEGGRGEGAGYC